MASSDMQIIEYTVRVIAPNQAAAEVLMYNALSDKMGAVWTRSKTPIKVLGLTSDSEE